jgi:NAD(P)H-dependent FMN reductase
MACWLRPNSDCWPEKATNRGTAEPKRELSCRSRSGSSRALLSKLNQRVGETSDKVCQSRTIGLAPLRKCAGQQTPASLRDGANDPFAVIRQPGFCSPQISRPVAPLDKIKAFQLGKLAADRGVVASDLVGKFRHAQPAPHAQPHKERKQGPVDAHLRFAQQSVVALRAAQEADQINQRGTQLVDIMCILHLYAASSLRYIACMIHAYRTLVIGGSVRPRRICPQIADWVAQIGRESVPGLLEVVDLKDWPLPMDDEPDVPARGDYLNKHTLAWSRKVADANAFIFVTPQYNWGYPAPLKNALDHLYEEWSEKPAMLVTYGGHGGDKCASQLRQVLDGLHMKPVPTMPALVLARERIVANAGLIEPNVEFGAHLGMLHKAFAELAAALVSA